MRRAPQEGQNPRRLQEKATSFSWKLLKGLQYIPRAIITDKLGSYAAAKAQILPNVAHIQDKRSNNRAENSHQPTRDLVFGRYGNRGDHCSALPSLLLFAPSAQSIGSELFGHWK